MAAAFAATSWPASMPIPRWFSPAAIARSDTSHLGADQAGEGEDDAEREQHGQDDRRDASETDATE